MANVMTNSAADSLLLSNMLTRPVYSAWLLSRWDRYCNPSALLARASMVVPRQGLINAKRSKKIEPATVIRVAILFATEITAIC
jgi:hypothetical protein